MSDIRWPWTELRFWQRHSCFSPGRVGIQPDAADFNLAVTLVAPWEEYVIDLSPDFQLKGGDDARNRVIPDTGTLEEKILDSWSASARVEVDVGKLSLGAAEHKPAAHDDSTDQSEPVGDTAPEHEPAADKPAKKTQGKQPAGAAKVEPPPAKPTRANASGQAIGKDPMLEYAAATALYQEVKLLNRYVADAALRRDYRAYVVRLQMSVVPFARDLPLDVYSNISFFPAAEKNGAIAKRYRAEIIPLLVTDNLENTIRSRSVESLRNLALTLSFLQPGIGGGGSLGNKRDDFRRALGGDLNSLLTVGRVSDNTLQVRLGAERSAASNGHATLPRTHNITVLMLVPADFVECEDPNTAPRITAVSKTSLRHAATGAELGRQPPDGRLSSVEDLCSKYLCSKYPGSNEHTNAEDINAEELLQSVFANDVERFERELRKAAAKKILEKHEVRRPGDGWKAAKVDEKITRFQAVADELNIPADRRMGIFADVDKAIRGRGLKEAGNVLKEAGSVFKDMVPEPPYMLDLWCNIVETLGASEFAAVRFELPPSACLPDDERVIAIDNGEHMMVRLQGGAGLNQNGVTATLLVKTTAGEILPIVPHADKPGTEINILAGGHGMTITFPSLAAWKLDEDLLFAPNSRRLLDGELRLKYAHGRKWSTKKGKDNEKRCTTVYYLKVENGKPAATPGGPDSPGSAFPQPPGGHDTSHAPRDHHAQPPGGHDTTHAPRDHRAQPPGGHDTTHAPRGHRAQPPSSHDAEPSGGDKE